VPTPVDSVSYRDLSWPELPSDREDFRENIVKRTDEHTPATVLGSAIWGDDTDVSNACRRAKPGNVDELLCDDGAIHKAQSWCVEIARKAIELVLGAKMGRSK
jgi:hypothetical protein